MLLSRAFRGILTVLFRGVQRQCLSVTKAEINPGGRFFLWPVRATIARRAGATREAPMKIGTFLALIGFLAIVGAIAAGVYFFGGYYNVAASEEDPWIVQKLLPLVRTASIKQHAVDKPPMSLDDPAVVKAGARAYRERACADCHGAPGPDNKTSGWEKFSEGIQPGPPDLKEEIAPNRSPEQLFWVIKNGINMTGMPSFKKIGVPDEEIWKIAAFVKKLPTVSEADYKSWTAAPVVTPLPTPR
jgi:mono/diheme cytochrome c family protein